MKTSLGSDFMKFFGGGGGGGGGNAAQAKKVTRGWSVSAFGQLDEANESRWPTRQTTRSQA